MTLDTVGCVCSEMVGVLGEASIPALLVLTKDDRITPAPTAPGVPEAARAIHATRQWLTARVRK